MSTKSLDTVQKELLLGKQNVCGAGIGKKWVNGKPTKQDAIIVFVQSKQTKQGMFKKFSINDMVPTTVDGIPTDVIEVGKIVKHGYKQKKRPIMPGFSCGHKNITAGTMGGFFYDKDNKPVILSNNHVLANENKSKKGDIIYQPGPHDSKSKPAFAGWKKPIDNFSYVGTLKDFVRLKKNGNTQDSAIAEIHPLLTDDNLVNPIYPFINRAMHGFGKANVNMQVQKCGRTTGYTTGRILSLNSTFSIEYDFGIAKFDDCIVTTGMSQGGDSGSAILDMNMNIVGLLFAGSKKVTLANPIQEIQNRYGLSIWNAPHGKTINLDEKWTAFTTDGSITNRKGIVYIKENANQHCYLEHTLNRDVKSVACTINTGSEKGATWGPGIVLQWPNGMIKINLRYGGPFGGYFNSQEYLTIGQTKTNKDYRLRLRKSNSTWIGEVQDDNKWYTILSVPSSIFPLNPVCVRIGKTGNLGSTRDYNNVGPVGSCTIKNFSLK